MHSFVSARSGAGGGSSGGERGCGGGATAVMEHVLPALACPFVVRTHRGYDEDVLDDVDNGVFRSTPATHAAFGSPALSNHSMEFVPGYSVSARDDMSPTQLVRAVQFSSLATVFPLSHHGTNNLLHASVKAEDPPVFQNHTASTTMGSDSGYRSQFMSTADRATPPLTSIAEMTQLDEQTILNRSVTIKKESGADDDRLSPFGAFSAQEAQPYQYNATKSELDEMEQIKWNVQQQLFKRYFELKQKEVHWGSLEVRADNRIFFLPGKRRQAILEEKRFHDMRFKRAIAEGDSTLLEDRQVHMAQLLRDFMREETKHKQEMMLAHLEKNSQFSKFPVLCNRFVLTRLLGKGGNGEVWDVVDFADQKTRWALKLSVSHKHARREHFTHSRLRHPHIARVGETAHTIEYRQQIYTGFTVESVDSDLQQLIEMHENFDEFSSLSVLYQLLSALTYLHDEMKIAHYDLKPTNILVGHDQCVKLTDFDLARNVHEPISSSVVGTLRYLPPECFRPNFGDCQGTAEKADIWMVGVVYCVMLWGKHPIISDKASHEEARSTLARYNGTLSYQRPVTDLSRWIIQGCMHPDPRCRPTAFQLLQALDSASQAHHSS